MPAPLPSAVASFILKMGFQIRRRIAPLAGVLLLSLIAARAALATNGTWSDTTSGGLWSATGNWSGGIVANGTDGIADFSTLNITADETVHLDTARTIGQVKFGDTTPSNNWILDNNGVATNVLTLAVSSGSPTITVNNDMATMDLVLAGTQGFTKAGAGELLLNDADTFTGSVAINAGTLALGNANALSSTSNAVNVSNGATLDLGGQTIGANPLTIQGTGVGGNGAMINSSPNPAIYAGNVTLLSAASVGGNGPITLSGTVSSSILTKIGNNTLILSGTTDDTNLGVAVNAGTVILAKTSSGFPNDVHAVGGAGLMVNGGIAQLGGTGGDQIYDSANVTVTSGAFDTNGLSETFATLNLQGTGIGGAGALVNSAAAFSTITPTGGTTLTGNATIGVTQSLAFLTLNNAIGGNFALTKTGSGTLFLSGTNTFSGGLAVQQGTLSTFGPNNASTNGVLGNNTSVTLGSSGQTATLEIGNNGTSNMPFTLAAGGTGEFSVLIGYNFQLSGAIGGTGALLADGGGTLTLSGNNTFTGGVTINGIALQVGNPGALNSSSPNSVAFNSRSSGTLSLNGFSVAISGLNFVTFSGSGAAPVVQNASSTAATLTVNTVSLNDTFAGTLQDGTGGGSLGLTKSGGGTLTLSGNNTFTGGASIQAGTLIVGNNNALGTGTLTAGGGALAADNNGPYVVTNPVSLPTTLIVSGSGNFTLAGPISGTGGLTKTWAGALTLSGVESFTGPINITSGSLVMSTSLTNNVTNSATFVYNSGTFGGRLTNLGTVVLNADFTAANGMENDGTFTLATGQTVTLSGAGLDNEGTFNLSGGTLNLNPAGNNVNRGNFNLSANLGLGTATLTNSGTLALAGGLVSGAGTLINTFGGTVSGSGAITSGFSNSGGLLSVGGGTLNITQPFLNTGVIQLNSVSANLSGGAITNVNTIQGLGNVGNAVTNNGTIESIGGTLLISGGLTNPATGLLRADEESKVLVASGLATNAGIVNLVGGTFDNGGQSLNNTGQISGFGIFATGGSGLNNNGSITFSGGLTTVNGQVTNEGGKTITVAQNNAIFTGLVTNNMNATFNTVSATATFAGGFVNNGNSDFAKAGNGVVEIDTAPTLNSGSTLSVTTGMLRFNVVSGVPTIGTGITAVVSSGATLELAGSVSALANGSNRVNIINNSNAPGILVSGTHQQVGNIDGAGTTQVNAGSDLTANHIIQNALIIGGAVGSTAVVTIDASDASGNPLDAALGGPLSQSSGFELAGSLTPSGPFGADGLSSADLSSGGGGAADLRVLSPANSALGGNPSSVPEPSSLVLLLLALGGLAGAGRSAARHTPANEFRGFR